MAHNANLQRLLEDTPEAFYWIGFLLADGSFSNGRIRFAIKDIEQLHKFGAFINYTGVYGECNGCKRISSMNLDQVALICKKFDIKERKTYNPPRSILHFSRQLVYALFAGFIDGDGCINYQTKRKDFRLSIKCHDSWLPILQEFNLLIGNAGSCKINNAGYAVLLVTNTVALKELKRVIQKLRVPILNRKWEIIDLDFIGKYEKARELEIKVIQMYQERKYKKKDIAQMCQTSTGNITRILKKYGIK